MYTYNVKMCNFPACNRKLCADRFPRQESVINGYAVAHNMTNLKDQYLLPKDV